MDIKLRAESWASILAIWALVIVLGSLLGQLSRQTYYGSPVLFMTAIFLFIILIIYTLQRTKQQFQG